MMSTMVRARYGNNIHRTCSTTIEIIYTVESNGSVSPGNYLHCHYFIILECCGPPQNAISIGVGGAD
jgi:hypothetical protein